MSKPKIALKSSIEKRAPLASLFTQAERILEAMPAAMIALDNQDRCTDMNNAAESMLRMSRSYAIHRPLTDLIFKDSPLFSMLAQTKEQNATIAAFDMALEGPKFHISHALVEISPLSEKEGGAILILRDRQPELRAAQRNAAENAAHSVQAIAMMLAHEIKNPLSGIRGAAQLLQSKLEDRDKALAELIQIETDRIVALVSGMEAFTDNRPAIMQDVNIHEILDHVRFLAKHGFASHITISDSYDPSLPLIRGNRDQLVQIFLNLIKNAAEAAPKIDGKITISTGYQIGLKIGERSSRAPGGYIFVAITDNGGGIPERLRLSLFDPFVSGKVGSKGLGLAMVAKLVRAHDGLVEFTTSPTKTTFTILLPVASRSVAESAR